MDKQLLEELKKQIGKECRTITLYMTNNTIDCDVTDLQVSKVIGAPFFPKSMVEEYPYTENGIPMVMLVQINFAEVPPMEGFPTSGLLQLYVNPFDWNEGSDIVIYWNEEQLKEESIDVYEEILKGVLEDVEFYLPAQHVHTMQFSKGVSYSAAEDKSYARQLSLMAKKYSSDVVEKFVKECPVEFGSRIGGYSDFTQYDPRRKVKDIVQLLQLDSEEGINFYDCGILHIFINRAELKKGNFENSVMYVDFY